MKVFRAPFDAGKMMAFAPIGKIPELEIFFDTFGAVAQVVNWDSEASWSGFSCAMRRPLVRISIP